MFTAVLITKAKTCKQPKCSQQKAAVGRYNRIYTFIHNGAARSAIRSNMGGP